MQCLVHIFCVCVHLVDVLKRLFGCKVKDSVHLLCLFAGVSGRPAPTWTAAVQGQEHRAASRPGGRGCQSHDECLCCLHQSGTGQAHVDNASGEVFKKNFLTLLSQLAL